MATVSSYTKTGVDDLITPIRYVSFSRKTASYTLVLADDHTCIEMDVATANDLTVPPNADQAIPVGGVVCVVQRGVGVTTIVPGASVTLNGLNSCLLSIGKNAHIWLHKVAANEWYVYGDLIPHMSFSRKTASYTLAIADNNKCIEMNVGSANNLTVPPNTDVAFPIGAMIDVTQYGAGLTTLVEGSGVTINSLSGYLTSAGQNARIHLHKVATDEWYAYGDIVSP